VGPHRVEEQVVLAHDALVATGAGAGAALTAEVAGSDDAVRVVPAVAEGTRLVTTRRLITFLTTTGRVVTWVVAVQALLS